MPSAEQNQKMETPSIPQAEQNVEEASKFKYCKEMKKVNYYFGPGARAAHQPLLY